MVDSIQTFDIPGYEDIYAISKCGKIWAYAKNYGFCPRLGRWLKLKEDKNGYLDVSFRKNNKSKTYKVHRLVGLTFIQNIEKKPCINHKNGIKNDNRVENLEWVTFSENTLHSFHVLNRTLPCAGRGKHGKNHGMSIRIDVKDADGNVSTYESIKDFGNKTGLPISSIYDVRISHPSIKNYQFKWGKLKNYTFTFYQG